MAAVALCPLCAASLLLAATATYEFPGDPSWEDHVVTKEEVAAAKAAKTDVFTHLFGDRAELVRRFNRLSPKHVRAGKTVRVPQVDVYVPVPETYPYEESDGKRILVVLELQFVGVYENGMLVTSYPAVTGDREHMTPPGDYKVSRKHKDHKSSKYPEPDGGWPMPWALRFNGNAYWIHAGDMVGRPASHGCVRLFLADAKELFDWADIGTVVKVVARLPPRPDEPNSCEPDL